MKNKVLFTIHYLWVSLVAYTMPLCIAWIFLDITGHAKGFGYDLGSEAGFSIMFGIIELSIWFAFALLPTITLFIKLKRKRKIYVLLSVAFFAALFSAYIYRNVGDWHKYFRVFHP